MADFPMGVGAGGGLIGILVLAAVIILPRLLGGDGSSSNLSTDTDAGGPTDCETELEQVVCGAVDDVSIYWEGQYPAVVPGAVPRRRHRLLLRIDQHGLRAGVRPDRAVLLSRRRTGVLRPRLPRAAAVRVRRHRRPRGPVHRRPRVRPSRPEGHRHRGSRAPGAAAVPRRRRTSSAWRSNCRPTVSPVPGRRRSPSVASSTVSTKSMRPSTRPKPSATTGSWSPPASEVNPESFTHGSAEQRRTWFQTGYSTGDPEQCLTFDNALAP